MKQGRTLQELAVELDRRAKSKRDFIVSASAMRMEDSAELFSLTRPLDSGMNEADDSAGSVEPFSMTDLFHRQIGAALNIPAKYYELCRKDYPKLLAKNVNGWLNKADSKHTVRTLDGTARAFLSDRYRRIDNDQIAMTVLPIIGEMPHARVESAEITDSRMYIKVVNPRLHGEIKKGDVVQAGIVISNSEVGLGSVSVMPLIYRLVCSNGMILQDFGQRKMHIGRANDEAWEIFSDETLRADDTAFMMKLADTVRTAVDEAKFAAIINKLRETADAKIIGSVPSVVELTSNQYGFNQSEQGNILMHLIQGGDLSLYGLGNAVTRAAQDVGSYDRSVEMEAKGWQIISMHPAIWKTINSEEVVKC